MRRFIAGLCCFIVGLQVLVGVQVAVCAAFLMYFGTNQVGPAAVEFRLSNSAAQPVVPNIMEDSCALANEADAVLEAREQRGSLLAGTMLGESASPADEQREFVAAFRRVADEAVDGRSAAIPTPSAAPANVLPGPAAPEISRETPSVIIQASADRYAVEHLYLMAEKDEQAGFHARSDQWRELARAIRGPVTPAACSDSAANAPRPLGVEVQ